MEMEFSKLEKLVGTFIVGVILVLMAILIIIGRGKDWFETYRTYYTYFNESYNLQANADVKLFKANIGKVSDITLEKDRVLVKVKILDRYASRIRRDAIAMVESPTLIGSEYVSIVPGSPDSPAINEGGEIPSREKRSLDDIMAEFELEKTAKLVVKAFQDFSTLTMFLADPQGPLQQSLENIAQASGHLAGITADLDAGKGVLGAALKSETLLRQIETNIAQLTNILASIDQTAAMAPDTMETVKQAGVSLGARLDEAQGLFEQIQKAIADLQIIAANLKTGSYQVPQISTTFRDGIQEIRQGVEQVNRVVDSLQQNVLIRSNLPQEPRPVGMDAGVRP